MSGGCQGVADYLRDFSKIFFDARLTPSSRAELKCEIHMADLLFDTGREET